MKTLLRPSQYAFAVSSAVYRAHLLAFHLSLPAYYPLQDPDGFCPRGCAMILRVIDPISFVVIVLCKTTQYVLANLLVMMVVMLAMTKR